MSLEREARQLVVDIVETYIDEGFAAAHQIMWDYLEDIHGDYRAEIRELRNELGS